jgi:hypothetical protein
MNYPGNTWQEIIWGNFGSDDFFLFCKNVTNMDAPETTTKIDNELAAYTNGQSWENLGNYAQYIKNYLIPTCEGAPIDSTDCFGTQNQTHFADVTNTGDRSYLYSSCTENGMYQAARLEGPTLLSRVVQVNYTQQWCKWAFPPGEHNSIPNTPDLDIYNGYGGYDVAADRLARIDGDQDVWLDACYHSHDAPPRRTTSVEDAYLHPQMLITGAGHHWDSYGIKNVSAEPQFIRAAHEWEIRVVRKWLDMLEEERGHGRRVDL